MYLNDIPLGQRCSFSIMGIEEAARLFFGKHVGNVTAAEAATTAAVIQAPAALSQFTNPAKCHDRRNVVLHAMADSGYITSDAADKASAEPLGIVERALETEAPYFVDFVGQTLNDQYPGLTTTTSQAVDVYTTLDLHLQKVAQDAMRGGLTHVDELLARRRRRGKAEAALIAVAQAAGYNHVSDFWKGLGIGNPPKPYPSIALGVFEATPYEIATAYTIFPNGGLLRPLKPILRIVRGGKDVTKKDPVKTRRV